MFDGALAQRQQESDHDAGQKSWQKSKKGKRVYFEDEQKPQTITLSGPMVNFLIALFTINCVVSIVGMGAVVYIAVQVNPMFSDLKQASEDAPKVMTKAGDLLDNTNGYMGNVTYRSKVWMDMADGVAGAWTADKMLQLSNHVLDVVDAAKGSNMTEIAASVGRLIRRASDIASMKALNINIPLLGLLGGGGGEGVT